MIGDVASMAMVESAEATVRNPWLPLPIGTREAHGPHLPLSSDMVQAERVCVRPGTLEALVPEILAGCVEKGAGRIAVISGHAGAAHLEALRQAAFPLVERVEDLTIPVIGLSDVAPPFAPGAGPAALDGHAGTVEASVMLAIDPGLVQTDRIPEAARPTVPRFQILPHAERLIPSGVMGDASAAPRGLGEPILEHFIGEIARILREGASSGRGGSTP